MRRDKTHDKDGLTLREALFARLYIISKGKGAQAARDAGYSGDLNTRATRLLDNPRVVSVIQRESAKMLAKLEVKAERVLDELCKIAFFNIQTIVRRGPNGQDEILPVALWSDEAKAAITSFGVRKGGMAIRCHSKIKALALLGEHLKLWEGSAEKAADRLGEVLAAFREGPIEGDSKKGPTVQ